MRGKLVLWMVICASFLFLAVFADHGAAQQKSIKWRIQSNYSPKSHVTRQLTWWADEVSKRTGGKIIFEIIPMNTLFKADEAFESVSDRIVEGTLCAFHYEAGKLPEGDIGWLPFIWNAEEYIKIWSGTDYMKVLNKAVNKFKLHQISVIGSGMFPLLSTFPVNALDDLKGKRIRAIAVEAEFLKKFGVAPVNIVPAELYMALKRGTMEGIFWPVYTLRDYKFYEVCTDVLMLGLHDNVEVDFYVNLAAFQELPVDIQKTMEEVGKDLVARAANEAETMNKAILDEVRQKGLSIAYPSKELQKTFLNTAKPFWEQGAAKSAISKELVDIILKVKGSGS